MSLFVIGFNHMQLELLVLLNAGVLFQKGGRKGDMFGIGY